MRGLSRPLLGYIGTLHDERLDLELIVALARRFSTGSLVLVGPNHLSLAARRKLGQCANIHLPGPVPYALVPAYLQAFDVCLLPHVVTPFTESLNPIKLWEYLVKPIRDHQLTLRYRLFPEIFGFIEDVSYSHGYAPGFIDDINSMKY